MHDLTKDGFWLLKVNLTADLDQSGRPITSRSKVDEYAYGIYVGFSIESEDKRFRFNAAGKIRQNEDYRFRVCSKEDPVGDATSNGFYTKDNDYKKYDKFWASKFGGGWWFDYDAFEFCANCQRDLVMADPFLAICGRDNPSEISMWMMRID